MILPLIVALYPVFFRYQSPIQRISIAEAVVIIVVLGMTILKRMRIKIDLTLLPFWGYLFLRTLFPLEAADTWDSIGTGLRLVFLYFSAAYIAPRFDYQKGVLYLNIVAVIISAYGLLQILLYSRYGLLVNTELPPIGRRSWRCGIYKKWVKNCE